MGLSVCDGRPLTDFTDRCAREFWGAVLPGAFTLFLTLAVIPLPHIPGPLGRAIDTVKAWLTDFLTLPEAEALDSGEGLEKLGEESEKPLVPLWRSVLLSSLSLAETLAWLSVGSYVLIAEPLDPWRNVRPFIVAFAWFYAASRPITRPTATPPYDLFVLFLLQFVLAIVLSGGLVYDNRVSGVPYPPTWVLVAHIANLVAVGALIILILSMPLAVPSRRVKKEDIVCLQSLFVESRIFIMLYRASPSVPRTTPRYGDGSRSTGSSR